MSDAVAAPLSTIGPYTVVSDEEREWAVSWDAVPELASDLGPFGLGFRIESMDYGYGPLEPDAEMFRLWDGWRGRHAEFVRELRRAVALHMQVVGASGDPAAQVVSAEVCIGRVDDQGGRSTRCLPPSRWSAMPNTRCSATWTPSPGSWSSSKARLTWRGSRH